MGDGVKNKVYIYRCGDKMAKIISIIGAKDGVGATTFAINLSFAVQKITTKKVLIMNLSTPGELEFAVGRKLRSINDACEMARKSSLAMLEGFLEIGHDGVSAVESGVGEGLGLECFKKIYDYIIIDLGSVVSSKTILALKESNEYVLAISSDPLVLLEAERKIHQFSRIFFRKEWLKIAAVNWADTETFPKSCVGERLGVCPVGFVGNYSEVSDSLKRRETFYTNKHNHQYSREVESAARLIIDNNKFVVTSGTCWDDLLPKKKVGQTIQEVFPVSSQTVQGVEKIKQKILGKLQDSSDLKDVSSSGLSIKTETKVLEIINNLRDEVPPEVDKKILLKEILNEALGLGPLETMIKDQTVTEIMVNACDQIYVERKGCLEPSMLKFTNNGQMMRIIERIIAPIGRRIDESSPMVDARLSDGSRVNVIIPPLSLSGPVITIRKFSATPLQSEDLVRQNSMTDEIKEFLCECVKRRLNILVSGGTGSGKTTLLNVISSFIPDNERIVTIEDSAELKLHQRHVVRLESRPPNIEGKGAVTIRDLVKNALRMRPDRIVVGECRGGEALDMLMAMNTGHNGSLTTIHANTPRDSISRLETLVMFSGIELSQKAIREQISSAIDIIVQLNRFSSGARKITKICQLVGLEGESITLQDLFYYKESNDQFISTGFKLREE